MPPIANQTVIVTGASRGIGLEFVKQLLARDNRVIAAVRQPTQARELQKLANVDVTELDVSKPDSVQAWAKRVGELTQHVDTVINNAGVYGRRVGLSDVRAEDMIHDFTVNSIGPLLVVQSLHQAGLLGGRAPSLVANVTSKMGSVDDNGSGGSYAYRASKAALNIITKSMAIDLGHENVQATLLHPGYVRTDMTGGNGLINVDQSVSGMLSVLESGRPLSGHWYAFDGKEIPW